MFCLGGVLIQSVNLQRTAFLLYVDQVCRGECLPSLNSIQFHVMMFTKAAGHHDDVDRDQDFGFDRSPGTKHELTCSMREKYSRNVRLMCRL